MTATLWSSVKSSFERALDLQQAERDAFLAALKDQEPEIFGLVHELLTSSAEANGFLETPPWQGGSAASAPRAFTPGQVLAERFEVEAFLGAGGAGEVYRAYDRHRGLRVALKTLRPGFYADQAAFDTLKQELNVASLVSHPNICRLYDITLRPNAGQVFISMELLNGVTLAERIRYGPLQSADAYPIVLQLVNGIAAAHERGVVHRDLKSGNVMLIESSAGLRAVITDFGLARETKPDDSLEATLSSSSFAGTPAYMAPEQLEGKRATRASDLHALGVIMFEMVTGRLPFEGETPLVIAAARLQNQAPSPRSIVPDLDPRWEHAIGACLERAPAKRPSSAFEIISLLTIPPPRRWPRRALLAAATLAGTAGFFVAVRPHPIRAEAQQAFHQGLIFSKTRSAQGLDNAIREFRKAVDLEPKWAEGWAQLAEAYASSSNFAVLDPAPALQQARLAAERAISLDNRLARAYGALAWTQSLDYSVWPEAEKTFRRAIQLDPEDANVRRWFASHLRKKGRFTQAEQQAKRGLELSHSEDPRLWTELSFIYFTAGRLQQFHTQVAEQHRLFPNEPLIELMLARSLELRGRFDEARESLGHAEMLGISPQTVLVQRASVEASQGNVETARRYARVVESLAGQKPIDGLLLAGVYGRIGDSDQAFSVLEAAYRRKDSTLLSLATSPVLESLRSDPRYRSWLRRLNFTDQIMQQMEFKASSRSVSGSQPK